jgi:acetylornithine deacetylase/succinyl-diaminopimelate desuccinylase-like protein
MNVGDAVRAEVEARREAFVGLLARMVRQPSISARGEGVREMAALELEVLAQHGWRAEAFDTPGQPVIVAHAGPKRGQAPQVLIYGHYDVQPPEPLALWHSPPFEPTVRDGRMFGRGAGDNKGQHLAHILGAHVLAEVAGDLPVGVTLVLEGEEESSSPHLEAFVAQHRDRLRADVAITSDGPMAPGDVPVVALGVRGILSFELSVQGARFDNHSGNKGNVVPDPTWRLIEVLSALRGPQGRVALPGFYDRVRPVGELEERALAALPFDPPAVADTLGLDEAAVGAWDGATYHRRLMLEPTFTINAIASGEIDQHKTIVPARARVRCDMRLVADQDPEEVEASLRAFLARRFPDVAYESHGWMRPSRTPLDHPAAAAVARALTRAHGRPALLQPALGGSLPDAVWTRTLGVPSLIVPYANADERNHAPDENIRLDLFLSGVVATAEILRELADALAGEGGEGRQALA